MPLHGNHAADETDLYGESYGESMESDTVEKPSEGHPKSKESVSRSHAIKTKTSNNLLIITRLL